jgi:hypothetical protein
MDESSENAVTRKKGAWEKLATSPNPYEIDEDSIGTSPAVYLYSNSIVQERFVDASTMLFLNTSKPLAGSAEATTTLNADGTLGSASSKEESKTFATVASLLPVSDLAKSIPPLASLAGPSKTYSFQTSIKTEFYKHTHSAASPPKQGSIPLTAENVPPCQPPSGTKDVVRMPANVTVEHVGDLPAPSPVPPTDAAKPDTPKKP